MVRIFGGPERYLQGVGAFDMLADLARPHGAVPAIIVDRDVLDLLGGRLEAQFSGRALVFPFAGEVTVPAIEAAAAAARDRAADLVIGVGGGKALDAAKGVARRLGLRFLSVPTVASNDSPASMSLAVYGDDHRIAAIERLDSSPVAVLVDTAMLVGAPPHFLLSGIGDAIAKKFEAERAAADGGRNFHGTGALRTALAIGDACYATLRAHAAAAMRAAHAGRVDDSFEAVVEANILMAGLAWEAGGLSIAHGVVRGLVASRITTPRHGLHVAYGLLVQLAFEERTDAFLEDMAAFYAEIGLPASLAQLGMANPAAAEIQAIARLSLIGPKGGMIIMPAEAEDLVRAIRRVESLCVKPALPGGIS